MIAPLERSHCGRTAVALRSHCGGEGEEADRMLDTLDIIGIMLLLTLWIILIFWESGNGKGDGLP